MSGSMFARYTSGVVYGDSIYSVETNTSFLFKINAINCEYKVQSYDAFWNNGSHRFVLDIVEYNGCLVATMIFSKNVIIYDLNSGIACEYGNDKQDVHRPQNFKSILYNNKIYIFPYAIGENIIVFDLISREYSDSLRLEVDNDLCERKNLGVILYKDKFWFFVHTTSKAYSLDPKDGHTCQYDFDINMRIDSAFCVRDHIWITEYKEPSIYEWTPEDGMLSKRYISAMSLTKGHLWISNLIQIDEVMVGLSSFRDCCFVFNPNGYENYCLDYRKYVSRLGAIQGSLFRCVLVYGSKFILMPHAINSFIVIDPVSGDIQSFSSELLHEDMLQFYKKCNTPLYEDNNYGLSEFINDI